MDVSGVIADQPAESWPIHLYLWLTRIATLLADPEYY